MIRRLRVKTSPHNTNALLLPRSPLLLYPSTSTSLSSSTLTSSSFSLVGGGAFRHTAVKYFIPPPLVRLLTVGGLFLFDVFYQAHKREAAKLAKEQRENASDGEGGTPSSTSNDGAGQPKMTGVEALKVLGLPEQWKVPLTEEAQREKARRSFLVCFAKAQKVESVYLQGKFAAAYRECVDAEWEAPAPAASSSDPKPPSA